MTKNSFTIRPDFLICLMLTLAVISVYWQVGSHEFISFDDSVYVTENRYVKAGLTRESMIWAFSFADKKGAYWQPLTWLSHMLDCELYGLNAGMHHRTNLLFHIANTILLFLVFGRITGELRKSAFVAALFALHPLNVDSVAWVAERKNLLSTFFWMLTIFAYVRYTESPSFIRYISVSLMFLSGLLAKPMIVTLPFVLLLLDHWPMGRFESLKSAALTSGIRSPTSVLLLEKLPLFMLSVISVSLSSSSLQHYENITVRGAPTDLRFANALVSYVGYIWKIICPRNLSVYYPYPEAIPLWQYTGGGLLLICVSILTLRTLKRMPCLATGWLWYLGTLVPVSGLIQTGLWPALADRWAYVPLIGIFVMMAWGIPEICKDREWRHAKTGLVIIAVMVLSILTVMTWFQVRYWKNNITLFEHALKVNPHNYVAHGHMGVALAAQEKTDEAIRHYTRILRSDPNDFKTLNNMGLALSDQGKPDEAIRYLSQALRLKPDYAKTLNNMGIVLAKQGKTEEAVHYFSEALKSDPDYAEPSYNMGNIFNNQGNINQAVEYYTRALRSSPYDAEIYNNLGIAMLRKKKINEAAACFQKALQNDPDNTEALGNLKMIMNSRKN
ncbi:Tetratricopeptide repeat-containing protein [Desulfonema magnum]|uniref:Tetratricopeptide repeat-containing protein n=1 Tax=Desulfonema magnum TaxID=45655 RepID=A0A975GST8_9BACT|nr:Tetratricopeptide repeat-containing protein [Desulfonema magnum]